MMAITFALLLAAFVLNLRTCRDRRWHASSCVIMVIGIFLWEIYSPAYGFRMPWLQVDLRHAAAVGST